MKTSSGPSRPCTECKKVAKCKLYVDSAGKIAYLCPDCQDLFRDESGEEE